MGSFKNRKTLAMGRRSSSSTSSAKRRARVSRQDRRKGRGNNRAAAALWGGSPRSRTMACKASGREAPPFIFLSTADRRRKSLPRKRRRRFQIWLKQCGIVTVAMQSTGVYWLPVYEVLVERGCEVFLVNARHTKNLPGRQSDVQECQWLMKLHTYGLLNNSFRPTEEICVLRTYWRQRDEHVKAASAVIQRMQKVLTEMNVQIANVISDISGVTGMAILDAILKGERDRYQLADLANPRIQASKEEIARSLEGNWRPELLFVLRQ